MNRKLPASLAKENQAKRLLGKLHAFGLRGAAAVREAAAKQVSQAFEAWFLGARGGRGLTDFGV